MTRYLPSGKETKKQLSNSNIWIYSRGYVAQDSHSGNMVYPKINYIKENNKFKIPDDMVI